MAFEPIGGLARHFLRTVQRSSQPIQPGADEIELAMTCLAAGYLQREPGSRCVSITDAGSAYLAKIAGAT